MIRLLKPHRGEVQTITVGNGSELAEYETMAKSVTATMFFCDPDSSGERGTNGNKNGLIRQYFPEGTDFRQATGAELRRVFKKLNDRSR